MQKVIIGNDELNKNLLENEQILLEEERILNTLINKKQEELAETQEQIKKIEIENENYQEHKNYLIKQFVVNIFEILGVFILFAIVPNILFNIRAEILKILYSGLASSCVVLDTCLFFVLKSEIEDYKKNKDENDYNGKNIEDLKEKKEQLYRDIKQLRNELRITTVRIDKLHITFKKRNMPISNNVYSNEDDSIKTKQKKIEKK